MKFIYTKWLALYHTGIESWLDWKELENQVLFRQVQERQTMVSTETDHVPKPRTMLMLRTILWLYKKMGSDDINVKIWWDNFNQ
jgi:hypothetical protein